jgi:predicted MFS family arabinose efflux permease
MQKGHVKRDSHSVRSFWRRLQLEASLWTPALVAMALSTFMQRFGMGILDGTRTNYFVNALGLSGNQVLWLEGIREIPGLALMFIAALTMHFALSHRAAVAVLIMGVGYSLYAWVGSYGALLAVAVFASLGMHMWMPIHSSLAMSLSPKEKAGSVMGTLNGVGSLAGIVGMGVLALIANVLPDLSLEFYYITGALFILIAGLFLFRVPSDVGATKTDPPRMLIQDRYWLYYVLTFLQGSRKQVLHTFGMLVLVENFDLQVWQISAILAVSSIVNLIGAPYLGRLLDRLGERTMLSISYSVLILCCLGFATIHSVWILVVLLIVVKLFVTLGMALSTYVYRIAPQEELTPTLSAGVSINHVTSVGMPLVAGALLPVIGYEGIFLGAAGLILISIPFVMAMKVNPETHQQPVAVSAD